SARWPPPPCCPGSAPGSPANTSTTAYAPAVSTCSTTCWNWPPGAAQPDRPARLPHLVGVVGVASRHEARPPVVGPPVVGPPVVGPPVRLRPWSPAPAPVARLRPWPSAPAPVARLRLCARG